jgi:hypothetical protein
MFDYLIDPFTDIIVCFDPDQSQFLASFLKLGYHLERN